MTIDTKRVRDLLASATPGPWCVYEESDGADDSVSEVMQARGIMSEESGGLNHGTDYELFTLPDADLIVAMRNELPAILDHLDRLEEVAKAARAYCGRNGAMDDIGYSLGGKELDEALARLDGGK